MSEKEKIYQSLKKQYTPEELADAVLLSDSSTGEDAISAKEEFVKLRMARRNALSAKEQLYSTILAFKYQIKSYFK